jgi:branched-chain amino acid transport system substrate-binding protein
MTDFTPLILKLKQLQPDVIVAPTYTNDSILFWRQARQLDLNVKAIVGAGTVGFGSPDFGKAFGDAAEGPFTLNVVAEVNPNALSKHGAALEAHVKQRYEAKYKEPYSGTALLGSTGVAILAEILKRTNGDLEPAKFRAAALALDLPLGTLVHGWGAKFDESGQIVDARVLFPVTQWQAGNQVTIWPERYSVSSAKHLPLPRWNERK